MNQQEKELWSGIKQIGHKGRLAQFGFSEAAIGEIVAEDLFVKDLAKERIETTEQERVQVFTEEGVDPEWAYETRRQCLESELKRKMRNYYEAKLSGCLTNEKQEVNKARAELMFYSYRNEYIAAGGITDEMIERAKQRKVTEFIKPIAKKRFALCPFHKEKTPSFCISDDGLKFYCFGCNECGDTIAFVMKQKNLSFREAVLVLV